MMNFGCLLLAFTFVSSAFAQTALQEPKAVEDQSMNELLESDLNFRNSEIGTPIITWWDSGDGYYGAYSRGSEEYRSCYDKKGNYIQTLVRKNWNDNSVPTSIKSAYGRSSYNLKQVTSYWEVTDVLTVGYYFELVDDQNKASKVWADGKGKFSNKPPDN